MVGVNAAFSADKSVLGFHADSEIDGGLCEIHICGDIYYLTMLKRQVIVQFKNRLVFLAMETTIQT